MDKPKFTICVNAEGYYEEGVTDNVVEVDDMPVVESLRHLQAYRYDENTSSLVLDEAKLEEIKEMIANEVSDAEFSDKERIKALESAVIELAGMVAEMKGEQYK